MPRLIRRSNLVEMVYEAIEDSVRRGELQVGGCQFTEAALCRKYNVSRPTVREALIRLRAKGMPAGRRTDGAYPGASLCKESVGLCHGDLASVDDIRKHVEFRRTMELGAVRHGALNRDAADVDALQAAFQALHEHSDSDRASVEADIMFHMRIARAGGNPVFVSVMESLRPHLLFTMNLSRQFSHPESCARRYAQIESEHCMIMEAIIDGDAQRAQAAMRTHLGNAAVRVLGKMQG